MRDVIQVMNFLRACWRASVGSCCLVGVICRGTLYIANLGDSCAVLGRLVRSTGEVLAIPLSAEHNVGIESVRQEMQSLHPDDPHIVVSKHDVWRVKGWLQIKIDRGVRRHFHDDITAVVIFLDSNLASRACSVRGPVTLSTDGGTNLPAKSLYSKPAQTKLRNEAQFLAQLVIYPSQCLVGFLRFSVVETVDRRFSLMDQNFYCIVGHQKKNLRW